MSDLKLRDLERKAASGDAEATIALWRERRRTCEHTWSSVGIHGRPGSKSRCSEHPNENEIEVHVCWDCHATKVQEGTKLCYFCGEPPSDDRPLVDTNSGQREHEDCARKLKTVSGRAAAVIGTTVQILAGSLVSIVQNYERFNKTLLAIDSIGQTRTSDTADPS